MAVTELYRDLRGVKVNAVHAVDVKVVVADTVHFGKIHVNSPFLQFSEGFFGYFIAFSIYFSKKKGIADELLSLYWNNLKITVVFFVLNANFVKSKKTHVIVTILRSKFFVLRLSAYLLYPCFFSA